MSRVAGHTLAHEGAAHDKSGWRVFEPGRRVGRGKCSCGALSPTLTSDRQRKDWHRRHKQVVAGAG